MSANTIWNVVVRKAYSETIQVCAAGPAEASWLAGKKPGVVLAERVEWLYSEETE